MGEGGGAVQEARSAGLSLVQTKLLLSQLSSAYSRRRRWPSIELVKLTGATAQPAGQVDAVHIGLPVEPFRSVGT